MRTLRACGPAFIQIEQIITITHYHQENCK